MELAAAAAARGCCHHHLLVNHDSWKVIQQPLYIDLTDVETNHPPTRKSFGCFLTYNTPETP